VVELATPGNLDRSGALSFSRKVRGVPVRKSSVLSTGGSPIDLRGAERRRETEALTTRRHDRSIRLPILLPLSLAISGLLGCTGQRLHVGEDFGAGGRGGSTGQAGSAAGAAGSILASGSGGSGGAIGPAGSGGRGGAIPTGTGGSATAGATGAGGTTGSGGSGGTATGGTTGTAGAGAGAGPVLTLLAGGSRIAPPARFNYPMGVASDGAGNLYVTDDGAIRKVVMASGDATTVAGAARQAGATDGTGTDARFYGPIGVAADGAGHLYVADTSNDLIRKIDIATGVVSTLAGTPPPYGQSPGWDDGIGAAARFRFPDGVVCDGAGTLYVADSGNNLIRKIDVSTGTVTTLAGGPGYLYGDYIDGTGTAARFYTPVGIVGDGTGNLYVTDIGNSVIRKVVIATGVVTTFAGAAGQKGNTDGRGAAARFDGPESIASDGSGNLYVGDINAHTLRKIVIATRDVTTIAGVAGQWGIADGEIADARLNTPYGLAADAGGNLYIADNDNHEIRKLDATAGALLPLAGSVAETGDVDGSGAGIGFNNPASVASDGAGNLYVADTAHQVIRKVVVATGAFTTFAGAGWPGSADGPAATASFNGPEGVIADGAGNLYVADTANGTIRKIVIATGAVTTLAGAPGQPGGADGVC
jgi:sugar lactone lactonase YvrE